MSEEKILTADEIEDLDFCRWMRERESWALGQWKDAWKVLTSAVPSPVEFPIGFQVLRPELLTPEKLGRRLACLIMNITEREMETRRTGAAWVGLPDRQIEQMTMLLNALEREGVIQREL